MFSFSLARFYLGLRSYQALNGRGEGKELARTFPSHVIKQDQINTNIYPWQSSSRVNKCNNSPVMPPTTCGSHAHYDVIISCVVCLRVRSAAAREFHE